MMTVLFFAKYREVLGTAKIYLSEADIDFEPLTVAGLKALLAARGEVWSEVLYAENTLCAVNQNLADDDTPINISDEIAFYPPVTGG